MNVAEDAGMLRALRAIASGRGRVRAAGAEGRAVLEGTDGAVGVARAVLQTLARRGLIAPSGGRLVATDAGLALLARADASGDPFQDQHRDLETVGIVLPEGPSTATVNRAESPLGQLMRRRDRGGRPFLTEDEFAAGERLRADYERGRIMPRLGANWEAPIATGRRNGTQAELTDSALAARQRVDRALDAVGPELSGVLVDVCCFLKGLETIESERGWPARSAKIVLRTALGALARHYRPGTNTARGRILAWGTADYRPEVG